MALQEDSLPGQGWIVEAYSQHGGEIFGFCRRVLGDAGLAEEVTQDAFVRAWKARDRFDRNRASLRTWLFQIARNAAIDAHRARSVRPALANDDAIDAAPAGSVDPVEQLADRTLLGQALAELPSAQREAVIAVHVRGHSYGEAADRLGVPAGTVKSRVFNGLRQLQELLADEVTGGDGRG